MFSEEMKQEMLEYGFTLQQIESKALTKFIEFVAEKQGLLDLELKRQCENLKKEYESLKYDCRNLKFVNRDFDAEIERKGEIVESLKSDIKKAGETLKSLKKEIDDLQERKCDESIDDAHARNFIGLIEKIRSMKLTDQELKTFGFIGNGFFNGITKDSPEEHNEQQKESVEEMYTQEQVQYAIDCASRDGQNGYTDNIVSDYL